MSPFKLTNPLTRLLTIGENAAYKKAVLIAEMASYFEEEYRQLSNGELQQQTQRLRKAYADANNEKRLIDEITAEAFAVFAEASARVLNKRPYRVQHIGAAALHNGAIAEAKTGEGKSLMAAMVAYAESLAGKGVHVVTVNDYLAKEQSEQMSRIFRTLDTTVGCITTDLSPHQRKMHYDADITYGTSKEFGFDYLRDNQVTSIENLIQRDHHFVIIDEADSILIDEARNPLILSESGNETSASYEKADRIVATMHKDVHYLVDLKQRRTSLTDDGIYFIEKKLGIENLYDEANVEILPYIENALQAHNLYRRDKDYIVTDDEIVLIDEHTGRTMPQSRLNDRLHQALEAKESVTIKPENVVVATTTLQNYFRKYTHISGMTGTAQREAAELNKTYNIDVISIPTNKPIARIDLPDLMYASEQEKFNAIAEQVVTCQKTGQPVLIGTTSIEKSERLSAILSNHGIVHQVLNAKNHTQEAHIVAQAGRRGAVTIATNMAGRGTDIILGGNAEHECELALSRRGLTPTGNPDTYEQEWNSLLPNFEKACQKEHDEVIDLGGLFVIGSERHESRRIDDQLCGRAGRQGDPGTTRFYLSLEDELLKIYGSQLVERFKKNVDPMAKIESSAAIRLIDRAQQQVEGHHKAQRSNMLKYDDIAAKQRDVIYEDRRKVLHDEVPSHLLDYGTREIDKIIAEHCNDLDSNQWNIPAAEHALSSLYPMTVLFRDIEETHGSLHAVTPNDLRREFISDFTLMLDLYTKQIEQNNNISSDHEKLVTLAAIDRHWRQHIEDLDTIREGIHLRSYAQKDPFVEYTREANLLYQDMLTNIARDVLSHYFGSYDELATFHHLVKTGELDFDIEPTTNIQ